MRSALSTMLRNTVGALNSPRAPKRLGLVILMATAAGTVLSPDVTVNAWATGLLLMFMVSLTIGVHEFCHLVVAAQGGIKVNAFYIGFGPVLAKTTRRGIEWGVRLYPIGGYVSLCGEERDEGPRSLYAASSRRKIAVLLAGPLSNFVLAFLILMGLAMGHGASLFEAPGIAWSLGSVVLDGTLSALGALLPATVDNPLNMPFMGVPGMVTTTSTLIGQGPDMVVVLIAVFSASIGFTNLLPIPPLDAGKALLVVFKVILQDRYPDAAGLRVQKYTFIGIIGFMIAINGIDLVRTIVGHQLPLTP